MPQGALEIVFPYGSEKEKWINDVTAAFNRRARRIQSGRQIFVRTLPMGSGESVDNILSGRVQAHVVSPASASFQIQLAVKEATDLDFVPSIFRAERTLT